MKMLRRAFVRNGMVAMFGAGSAPLWLARAAGGRTASKRRVLVALFQRGAADGLNIVVPHGERAYYKLRPSLAIPKGDIVDLDGFFGLHPSMAALKPLFDRKQLAVVHATGSPDPTRSHFDAQDYMESGTPGRKSTADGWLNRTLPESAASPVSAISMGQVLPRALRGSKPAVAVAAIPSFRLRNDQTATSFQELYRDDRQLGSAADSTFAALKLLQSVPDTAPAAGVVYPSTPFGRSLQQIARIIKADVGLEVAFADMGGWDTHVNELPQLGNLLSSFGNSLAAFANDLGDDMEHVAVVTMSEFGRTAAENGTRGTDHGHANVMFVMGSNVRGGKVYGDWPGLEPEQLYQRRDLAVTTDFRSVLSELTERHLGISGAQSVFPGFQPRSLGLLRS